MVLLFFLLARATVAQAPIIKNEEQIDESGKYKFTEDGAIQPLPAAFASGETKVGISPSLESKSRKSVAGGQHSTRAEKQISSGAIRTYLASKNSPLAAFSDQISQSPYSSTIIGICTIEQYGCTRAPYNNYWGIMCGRGTLCRYTGLEEGIKAIDSLLTKYEARGYDTIEKLNCYYVQPCSQNWFNTVLKTKTRLELLTSP